MASGDHMLWTEKYRPLFLKDVILPSKLKTQFEQMAATGSIPHLLLTGSAGVGKTTVAQALVNAIGGESLIINSSLYGNIDTLRNEVMNYASAVSFSGRRKFVILDEADYLNPTSTQPALRNFMETFSKNCGFILTCNYENRIIKELRSRCVEISFSVDRAERPMIARSYMKLLEDILREEKVHVHPDVLPPFVLKYFPDLRQTINELQLACAGSVLSAAALNEDQTTLADLVSHMKARDFTSVRKWVAENSHIDQITLFRSLYDRLCTLVKPSSIPEIVIVVANYQYKAAFAVDQEINTAACLAEIMVLAQWN